MINSTNTVNIDGVAIKEFDLKKSFSVDNDDNFTRWVVRPLAILAAIGVGVAMFFASAVLVVVSLALLPLLAVAMWAMKTKIERDLQESETVEISAATLDEDGQTAG